MSNTLHPVYPAGIEMGNIESWLEQYNIEKFKHDNQIIFTEDELNEKGREVSESTAQIMDLDDIVSQVKKVVDNGLQLDKAVFEIPLTPGKKALAIRCKELAKEVQKGYRVESIDIYGVPYAETEQVLYFDRSGNEVPSRHRKMTPKERHHYIGMFQGGAKLVVNQ